MKLVDLKLKLVGLDATDDDVGLAEVLLDATGAREVSDGVAVIPAGVLEIAEYSDLGIVEADGVPSTKADVINLAGGCNAITGEPPLVDGVLLPKLNVIGPVAWLNFGKL